MTRDDLPPAEEDLDPEDDINDAGNDDLSNLNHPEDDANDAGKDDLSNPNHPDHDLSEWSPYTTPFESKPWFVRRGAVLVVSVLVLLGLILPFLLRF